MANIFSFVFTQDCSKIDVPRKGKLLPNMVHMYLLFLARIPAVLVKKTSVLSTLPLNNYLNLHTFH